MTDLRDRDHDIYDRGRPDPYHRPPVRSYHSPSPDRRGYERRTPRFLDEIDSDDGRSDGRSAGPSRGPVYRDEHHYQPPLRRAPSPDYYDDPRRLMIDRERERERERQYRRAYARDRSPSPAVLPRPGILRRQSSLDTFDRPRGNDLHFLEREEYGPPARRQDIRYASPSPSSHAARSRGPDRYARFLDEYDNGGAMSSMALQRPSRSNVSDRVRWRGEEEEIVKVRRRRRSRDSLTSRTRSKSSESSSSSSESSSESSRSRGTSVRSEFPKKGKTKIPERMVSKRALIDLGYLFVEEGKSIIILKALGQEQIDQVLRISEEYKKAELEISAARSSAGNVESRHEEFRIPPHMHVHPPPTVVHTAPPHQVEFAGETVIRDVSPSRSYATSTYPSSMTGTSASALTAGPLALRSRSQSRAGREIRAEIRALEEELREEKRLEKHRRRSGSVGGDMVRVEKVGEGQQQVVIFEEEKIEKKEGYRGPRIERDRRGRLSLSVPKRR